MDINAEFSKLLNTLTEEPLDHIRGHLMSEPKNYVVVSISGESLSFSHPMTYKEGAAMVASMGEEKAVLIHKDGMVSRRPATV